MGLSDPICEMGESGWPVFLSPPDFVVKGVFFFSGTQPTANTVPHSFESTWDEPWETRNFPLQLESHGDVPWGLGRGDARAGGGQARGGQVRWSPGAARGQHEHGLRPLRERWPRSRLGKESCARLCA
jgi:hypothetical protein